MIEKLDKSTEYYKICRSVKIPLNEQLHTDDLAGNEKEHSSLKKMREDAFEEYRKEYHPNCPSRNSSLFICTHDLVPLWIKKLTQFRCEFTVLRLELTGHVFGANASDFDDDNKSEYWKGCNRDDKEAIPEGLFIGDFKAISDCTSNFKIN